jgi:hypothetical protein
MCSDYRIAEKYPALCKDSKNTVKPNDFAQKQPSPAIAKNSGSDAIKKDNGVNKPSIQDVPQKNQASVTSELSSLGRKESQQNVAPQTVTKMPASSETKSARPDLRIASNQTHNQIPANIGNWRIKKDADQMSDQPSCLAFLDRNSQVQLYHDTFFIGLRGRGGIQSITLRFDDKPAQPMRIPSRIEKELSSINFTRSEFDELQRSKRLRVEVSTVLNHIWRDDIDLNGHLDALEQLRGANCR